MSDATIAFYATAATVIPVFFLAIAVQGDLYQNMGNLVSAKLTAAVGKGQPAAIKAFGTWGGIMFVGLLILLFGVVGELVAIGDLASGSDDGFDRGFVVWAIIVLVIAVAVGPGARVFWVRMDLSEPPSNALPVKDSPPPTNLTPSPAARQLPKWARQAQLKARRDAARKANRP